MATVLAGACSMGSEEGGRNSSAEGASGASPPCNQTLLKPPTFSPEGTVAFATAIILMVLFTIVGNILVIIAVLTSRSLRGPQNLFLVSLAAADILVATLIVPFSLAKELMGYWYFRSVWCEIYLALDVFFCTSSIVHLCAISLDRYLSISRAVTYGAQRTPRRIKGAILVVWLISAVISFPPLLSMNKNKGGEGADGLPACKLNDETWYILYSTIGSFFAPCLIMILVYVRIYQIAMQRTRCPPGEQRKEGSPATMMTPRASIQAQQNGSNDSGPATAQKSHTHRPHSLTVPLSPFLLQARKCSNAHNIPQPPSPSPTATPTTPSSPSAPSPTLLHSLSSAHPPDKAQRLKAGKKAKRGGKKPVNNNSESSSSDSDQEPGKEGPQVTASGLHSPASVQKYRDMIATSKGAVLVGWRSKQEGTPTLARSKAMVNREKRFTFVLAVVIGVFVVCWFPFFLSYSLRAVCPEACSLPDPVFTFFFWIGYCNSCLNPVIYTIFNKDFRRAFKKILCKNTKGTFF